jgi:hypothetical protein
MLDFRRHKRTTGYLGWGVERRLLVLLVGSGLVVLLIVGAGNPSNWRWIGRDAKQATAPGRVADHEQPVVGAARGTPADDTSRAADHDQRPARDAIRDDDDRLFPGVRTDYLAAVRDDTVFRPAESDAWFHLLAVLARSDNDQLVKASEGPVTHLQLDGQPNEYRGRLVTIGGIARAAKQVAAPENAFDVKGYYQLWIQADRGASELFVLYCLELPQGFPLGERIDAECTATGFFFKRWAYPSQGGITTAPLVVAKTLIWQPAPVEEPPAEMPLGEQLLTALVVSLLLAALALAFVLWRGAGPQ